MGALAMDGLGCAEGAASSGLGGSAPEGGGAGSGGSIGTGGSIETGGSTGPGGSTGTGGSIGSGGSAGGFPGTGGYGSVGLARLGSVELALGRFVSEDGAGCLVMQKEVAGCSLYTTSAACHSVDHDGGTLTIETPMATTTLMFGVPVTASAVPLFSPGQTVKISSTGAEVPAFSGTVVAPSPVALLSPSFDGPLDVTMSEGLPLTWEPAEGHVLAFLTNEGSGAASRLLTCVFDAASGAGTMPPEALLAYGPGTVEFIVYANGQTTILAGDWPVNLFVDIQAKDPLGNDTQTPVTLH